MKTARQHLSQRHLMETLDYCQSTGIFTRKTTRGRWRAGDAAGCVHSNGYVYIAINRVLFLAHRLAWLYVTGRMPTEDIDHIDGCKTNNAFANLRDVSAAINSQNQRRPRTDNKTGFLGVTSSPFGFVAHIGLGGKATHLGVFETPELAHAAYLAAKRQVHAGCTI